MIEPTIGPWKAFANRVWGADNTIICTVSISDMAQDNVNGRMLAASWEMREALIAMLEYEHSYTGDYHSCKLPTCMQAIAALSKANNLYNE